MRDVGTDSALLLFDTDSAGVCSETLSYLRVILGSTACAWCATSPALAELPLHAVSCFKIPIRRVRHSTRYRRYREVGS